MQFRATDEPWVITTWSHEAAILSVQEAGNGPWIVNNGSAGEAVRTGQNVFVPAGCRVTHQWPVDTLVLAISIVGDSVGQVSNTQLLEPLARRPFRDAFTAMCASQLWSHTADRHEGGNDRFADVLLEALACRVAALAHAASRPAPPSAAPVLSRAVLTRVLNHIDANLEEPLPIEDLAGVSGLSHFQFCRAFKEATGEPPYRYVLGRRVARARHLVTSSNTSLAEIAYACGFSSQAHMTSTFTKVLGASPGRLRRRGEERMES